MDDDSPVTRWERRVDAPLAVASLLYLASYAVLVLGEGLPTAVAVGCRAVLAVSWAVFALDYGVRWRLSGRGAHFVRRHWLDTLVVLLPLLRPVRIVRVYDAVQRRRGGPRWPLQARVMLYAGLSALLLGLAASLSVYGVEHRAPHATIRTFGDSVWWACSTLATVGYGDVVPVTATGRVVAVGLMGCGLALLGAVTGSFSSWLMQRFAQPGDERRPPGS
ncbi:potassium channel family protein [Streptomyces sp. NPDC056160]|uniref:potassium channel family protein n=1 Tax=Streptomyces sp. NPDC056160 TaxID=3345731 RepID=UPI0035E2EBA2